MFTCPLCLLFASRLKRSAPIRERAVRMLRKDWRILIDESKRGSENRCRRTAILVEHYQLCCWKVAVKQLEGLARCPTKTIDRLIGITDCEQVSARPGKARQNLDLGEVGILKFVR